MNFQEAIITIPERQNVCLVVGIDYHGYRVVSISDGEPDGIPPNDGDYMIIFEDRDGARYKVTNSQFRTSNGIKPSCMLLPDAEEDGFLSGTIIAVPSGLLQLSYKTSKATLRRVLEQKAA